MPKRKPGYRTVIRGAVPLSVPMRMLSSVALTAAMAGPLLPVTFPTVPLRPRVMIALSADPSADPTTWLWEDITRFVRWKDGITVTDGRPDQSSIVRPGEAQMTLNNRDGRFSRRNPMGVYYGKLSKNTPIWIQFDPGPGQVTVGQMFVNEWPTRWDRTTTDSFVTIKCAGVLRRLQQGEVLKSPLSRAISASGPVASWPLEDEANVTQAASALPGGPPLTVQQGGITFGNSEPLIPGIARGPNFAGGQVVVNGARGGTMTAPLSGMNATGFSFEFVGLNEGGPSLGMGTQVDVLCVGGTIVKWIVKAPLNPGLGVSLFLNAQTATNTITAALTFPDIPDPALPHHYRVELRQSGSDVAGTFYVDGVGYPVSVAGQTLGVPYQVILNPLHVALNDDQITGTIAALAFYNATTIPNHFSAVSAYTGELAHTRIRRLCNEEAVPFTGASASSEALGPQPVDTFLNIVREAEAADQGVLYETGWGLGYQTLPDRYNRPVSMALDFARSHIKGDPQPADDDQRLRNRWTVTRKGGGSSYVAENSSSVAVDGLYQDSVTINVSSDTVIPSQAQWRVHATTVDEDRWPALGLKLNATPDLIPTFSAMGYGSRITVDHVPNNGDPNQLDLVVEGRTVKFTNMTCDVDLQTSTNTIYNVYGIKTDLGTNLSRIPSARGQSTLNGALDTTQQNVGVVWSSKRWIDSATYPTQFPFDVTFGGERVTVLSIVSNRTAPSIRSSTAIGFQGSGYANKPTGTATGDVLIAFHATDVTTGMGVPPTGGPWQLLHDHSTDTAEANDTHRTNVWYKVAEGSEPASYFFTADNAAPASSVVTILAIQNADPSVVPVSGFTETTATQATTPTPSTTPTGSNDLEIRWASGVAETPPAARSWTPPAGFTEQTDLSQINWTHTTSAWMALNSSGATGVASFTASGNMITGHGYTLDIAGVISSQTFTVTRSVNGVVKSHVSGEEVQLFRPPVIAR